MNPKLQYIAILSALIPNNAYIMNVFVLILILDRQYTPKMEQNINLSHSQVVQYCCFRWVGQTGHRLNASIFEEAGIPSASVVDDLGIKLNNQLSF